MSTAVAAARPLALRVPRPPRWLVGWWAAGRLVVVVTAFALRPSVWTLDRWDGHWYGLVAQEGYLLVPGRPSDPAFFPLYPILLRGLNAAGLGWGVVGPLVSNLALLLGLLLFYALTRELFDEPLARRATTYLAIFPLGYVFSMEYPESLVLVLVAAAPLAALRRRWWLAALCAGAAALARPEGLFLVLPLAGIAWSQRAELGPVRRGTALAAIVAPAAALVSYSLYLASVLHDPFAWSQAETAWRRNFRPTGAVSAFEHIPGMLARNSWLLRDLLFFLLYLGLLWAAWRLGTPRGWLAAAAAIVVLPVFSGTFTSIGRFGLLAPPLVWGLAGLAHTRTRDRIVRVMSLVLLVVGTVSIAWVWP